jgi:FixJ family two-component response regulator
MVQEAGALAFINKPLAADQVLNAVNLALKETSDGTD